MAASLLLVLLLAVAVAVATALVRRTPPSSDQSVAAARVHARRGVVAATGVGAVAAIGTAVSRVGDTGPGGLGVTALLVPTAFGIGALLCLLLAELTWPRPDGAVRRADLVHRSSLDAPPRWLVRAAALAVVAAGVVLGGGALLADDSGRGYTWASSDGVFSATSSPFPGAFYGVPAALGLVVVWALALAGLRVVAERPAVTVDDPATETALRRASAHRLLRTAVGTTAVVVGGLLAVGGDALRSAASFDAVWGPAPWVAGLLGVAGALAGVVLVLLPAPRLPEPSSPAPGRSP